MKRKTDFSLAASNNTGSSANSRVDDLESLAETEQIPEHQPEVLTEPTVMTDEAQTNPVNLTTTTTLKTTSTAASTTQASTISTTVTTQASTITPANNPSSVPLETKSQIEIVNNATTFTSRANSNNINALDTNQVRSQITDPLAHAVTQNTSKADKFDQDYPNFQAKGWQAYFQSAKLNLITSP